MKKPNILVLGIGNYLMGDEGIGIHMIKTLEKLELPENVTMLDGGTGGFHLLSYLEENDYVIIVDATMDESPEGTIQVITPKYASDFPPCLSAHEIGLKDLIDSLYLLGKEPEMKLITVGIKKIQPMSMELSPKIESVQGSIADIVSELLAEDLKLPDLLSTTK